MKLILLVDCLGDACLVIGLSWWGIKCDLVVTDLVDSAVGYLIVRRHQWVDFAVV